MASSVGNFIKQDPRSRTPLKVMLAIVMVLLRRPVKLDHPPGT